MYIDNFCNECGTKIRPQAKFCEGCGRKIQTQEEMKVQLIKEIENEVKTKTRNELLAEMQVSKDIEKERNLNPKKSTDDSIIFYKKGDLYYAIVIIVFLFLFLIIISFIL
jgi:hypothetical protein